MQAWCVALEAYAMLLFNINYVHTLRSNDLFHIIGNVHKGSAFYLLAKKLTF